MTVLTGKVAIVTGASSGIGRAAALLFARQGARLVLAARRAAELEVLASEIASAGGEAVPLAGDVRDGGYARALVELAVGRFGGLDVAVNNAGATGTLAEVAALPPDAWRETIDANLTSAFLCARHQVPALEARGGGSLIFTSSFVGYTVGLPGMGAYAAAKAGVVGLTKVLAAELGAKRIRVNAILPGGTDTPMGREVIDTPETRRFIEGLHALKRLAEPEEIARSILHLASDASSFMTGTAMLVDGGISVTRG